MKTCTRCKEEKPLDDFYWTNKEHTKRDYYCKACQSELKAARNRASRPAKYGITWDDYNRMLDEQGGCCAICKIDQPNATRTVWCIDHDHATGKVRGLLCHECNTGLGKFQDDIGILGRAIEYLAKG